MATRTQKRCSKCGESKARTEFHKNKTTKDGLQGWCKQCLTKKVYEGQVKSSSHKSQKTWKNRAYVWNYLLDHPCAHCGIDDPRVMDFDHLDPATKKAEISYLITRGSLETLKAEIEKCQVLCANCHRIRTADQFNYWWTKLPF